MKKRTRIALGVTLFLIIALVGWVLFVVRSDPGPAYIVRPVDTKPHDFIAAALFAASDADMVGSSYADGVLYPMNGAHDALSRVDVNHGAVHSSSSTVTNSVTAWPGTLELSPDAHYGYVVESRGPAPPNVDRVKNVHTDLKEGRLLTTLDLSAEEPKVVRQDDIALDPTSVAVAPNGQWLAISARDDASPITLVPLDHGVPIEMRHPHSPLPSVPPPPKQAMERENYGGVGYVRIAPNGHTIAVHMQSMYLVLGELIFDDVGRPLDIRFGPLLQVGSFISVGRWSLDGRYYIVSDTNWGHFSDNALFARSGQVIALAVDDLNAKVVSTAAVSLSPEAMEMSRDGSLFVTVNMERTYLPQKFPYNLFKRGRQASLSLVSFDATSGALRTIDGPLAFEAVLPEDAAFDRDANAIAVAIFNDLNQPPTDGWIELFAIDRSKGTPQLLPTGKRIRMPRGVHDLAVAY